MPQKAVENFQAWLNANEKPFGTRLPSIRALARELDIGRMALNRAVTELVGRGVLIRRGNRLFTGHRTKQVLSRLPIDVFVERSLDIQPVEEIMDRWAIQVRVHFSGEAADRRRQLLELLDDREGSSGVLIYGAEWEAELLQIRSRGIPIVVVGDRSRHLSFVTHHPRSMVETALRHLVELGHSEIAFIAPPSTQPFPLMHVEVESSHQRECLALGMESSAKRMIDDVDDKPSLLRAWQKIRRELHEVTALICENFYISESLAALARADGIEIPQDLSIMQVYNQGSKPSSDWRISGLYLDEKQMLRTATLMLLDDIESRRSETGRPIQQSALCQPRLYLRESTAPPPAAKVLALQNLAATVEPKSPRAPKDIPVPSKQESVPVPAHHLSSGNLRQLNRLSFALPKEKNPTFSNISLSPYLNRELARHNGWMGRLPLLHFPPGVQYLQDIPFRIEKQAVVLRSSHARKHRRAPLPEHLEFPIHQNLDGLFILHAAGWAKYHEPFAIYEFQTEVGKDLVEVVPYGTEPCSKDPDLERLRRNRSNLADWHPSCPWFKSDRTIPYFVALDHDPRRYLRILYIYHWKNPDPNSALQTLTTRILNPAAQPTLAIIALTGYRYADP